MDGLESALVIVICINLMLVLGQLAVVKTVPGFSGSIVDCKNSPLGQYGNCSNGHYSINSGSPNLPSSTSSVDSSGNVFTDIYNTVKGWFNSIPGMKYVTAVVVAPSSFLKGMNLDPDFANLIGGAWWIITGLLIVSYLKR